MISNEYRILPRFPSGMTARGNLLEVCIYFVNNALTDAFQATLQERTGSSIIGKGWLEEWAKLSFARKKGVVRDYAQP